MAPWSHEHSCVAASLWLIVYRECLLGRDRGPGSSCCVHPLAQGPGALKSSPQFVFVGQVIMPETRNITRGYLCSMVMLDKCGQAHEQILVILF